ncbi:MAG: hypothetical protein ABIH83_03190 [Candidatus Micrarchaeota archaeon]
MEEKKSPQERMEQKIRDKKTLIRKLRETNNYSSQLQKELNAAFPRNADRKTNPAKIKEKIDRIEFQIATSAYTPAQEKELIRKVEALKKEMEKAMKNSKEWEKVREIRDKLKEKRNERNGIRKELDKISKDLDEIYKSIIERGTKSVMERGERKKKWEEATGRAKRREEIKKRKGEERIEREKQKKEMKPYMKEMNSFVSLEDIAEVKKKK